MLPKGWSQAETKMETNFPNFYNAKEKDKKKTLS